VLRRLLILLGLLYILGGLALLVTQNVSWLVPYLLINGTILVAAIVLERRGYNPITNRGRGRWQRTGERFVDPTTGKLMEVHYNPDTGERDYVEVGGVPPEGAAK